MIINNVNSLLNNSSESLKSDKVSNTSFMSFLNDAVNNVDNLQKQADESNTLLAAGKVDNLHKVMIDGAKAEIALQLTVQIRNKIVDAYNEIMRMNL